MHVPVSKTEPFAGCGVQTLMQNSVRCDLLVQRGVVTNLSWRQGRHCLVIWVCCLRQGLLIVEDGAAWRERHQFWVSRTVAFQIFATLSLVLIYTRAMLKLTY